MFDTLKALWAGFSGELRENGEARKLVWLLLVAFIAGWLATAFAAWVSFPSYRAMIDYLPGATVIAWAFTLGIAGFLYFDLAYLAGFFIERWNGISRETRDYSFLGARIFGICAILFLATDVYMNLQGVGYKADQAAGSITLFEYQTPVNIIDQVQDDRQKLNQLLAGKLGGYGWRNPKTRVFHLNNSGKKLQRSLSSNIARLQAQDSTARAAFLSDQAALNSQRQELKERAGATLERAVYGVYVFVFLLTIVQAYIVESIQLATGASVKEAQMGETSTGGRKSILSGLAQKISNNTTKGATAPSGAITASSGGGYLISCKNCGKQARKKHHAAKYCSDECRVSAWENRTGAKVKKGKKGPAGIGYK